MLANNDVFEEVGSLIISFSTLITKNSFIIEVLGFIFIAYLCTCLRFDSNHGKTVEITAQALGDPSMTLEEVTPSVFPSGQLLPNEVCRLLANVFLDE